MSSPEPSNIDNFDKDTQDKIKQMAQAQGVSLTDFLDGLMKNEPLPKKDISVQQHKMLADTVPQSMKMRLHTLEKVKTDITSNVQDISVAQATQTNQNVAPKTEQPAKEKPQAEQKKILHTKNNASTTSKSMPKKSVRQSSSPKKPEHNLFNTLTQKIGINTPIISELADSNITDTILRERQLRDFMRIQMTEMRDIMGTLFDKKIDTKLQQFSFRVDDGTGKHIIQQSIMPEIDTSDLLKTEDFNTKFTFFSHTLQKTISENISQELSATIDAMLHKSGEQYQFIIDNIQNINDSILENVDKHVKNVIEQTFEKHSLQSENSQANDIDTQLLSSRIERIENVCNAFNNKITLMHTDFNNNKNSNLSDDIINNIKAINAELNTELKTEITQAMQSIPEYMEKIIKITNTNNGEVHKNNKDNQHILNYLRTVLERLLKLENGVKKISVPQTAVHNPDEANGVNSKHQNQIDLHDIHTEEDEEDDDDNEVDINDILHHDEKKQNQLDNTADFLEGNDWDDNDTQDFKKPSFSNKINSYDDDDDDENENDIRSFDRKAMLKGVRANASSKSSRNTNSNQSGIKKLMPSGSLPQIMLICGGVIAILAIVGIIIV